MEFRILKEEDIDFYRAIRLDCLQNYPDNFGTLYEDEVQAKNLTFDKIIREKDAESFMMGAFSGKDLIGIAGFYRETRTKTKHRGEINQMYVKAEFARQGVGANLLRHLLDRAFTNETLDIIELGVVEGNTTALNLYRKFGFIQFGYLEKYFKHEEKYWAMTFMFLTRERYLHLEKLL
jgi:ribosomal protein S18 acetylase RimI-like enzyme